MKYSKFILVFALLVSGCAEMNSLVPGSFANSLGRSTDDSSTQDPDAISAQDMQSKSPRERQIALYDQRIRAATRQCVESENGCNKGCIGIGAVGIISILLGNTTGASASQDQATQCTNRCDQAKTECDQNVQSIVEEKEQYMAGYTGGNSSNPTSQSSAAGQDDPKVFGGSSGSPRSVAVVAANSGSVTCASTQQESFKMFDREFAALTSRFPNRGAPNSGGAGARAQYQYAYFFGNSGLEILEKYRTCLSNADYQANRNALIGSRDKGKSGCEQLSSGVGTCTPTYPWR